MYRATRKARDLAAPLWDLAAGSSLALLPAGQAVADLILALDRPATDAPGFVLAVRHRRDLVSDASGRVFRLPQGCARCLRCVWQTSPVCVLCQGFGYWRPDPENAHSSSASAPTAINGLIPPLDVEPTGANVTDDGSTGTRPPGLTPGSRPKRS